MRLTRRRSVQELGALEDVLVALCREHQIVLGDVVPHEAVFVAPAGSYTDQPSQRRKLNPRQKQSMGVPLAGPGVHGRHALPSQHVKAVNHIYGAMNRNRIRGQR